MNPKLLEAARSGDKKILDELLQQKHFSSEASMGEIAIMVPEDAAIQQFARFLLEENMALHIAASRGDLELAEEICRKERSLLAVRDIRQNTPLHCAARTGNDEMVSLLLESVPRDDNEVLRATNRNGNNALHEAAQYDHARVAEILIKEDVVLASMLNSGGMSPLYLAIAAGSLNVAKALLQSSTWPKQASPAYYAGPNDETVLHRAVLVSQEMSEEILEREPMLAKSRDLLGRLPLHLAASHGHRDAAKLLLKHNPHGVYMPDALGFCPIHAAAMEGNVPVVDEILKERPHTVDLLDKRGGNFLHAAFRRGGVDVVKKILSKRPDLRRLLNDQDSDGNTPLHTAVINSDQDSVDFLLRDKTTRVNVINRANCTPLDLAFEELQPGMSDKTHAASCILSSLAFTKALPGPPQPLLLSKMITLSSDEGKTKPSGIDEIKEESPSDEIKKKPSGIDEIKEESPSDEIKKKPSGIDGIKEESPSDEIKKKPSGIDEIKEEMKRGLGQEIRKWRDEEVKKELDVPKNFVIATVLIATVTFAAGFTLPGGYIADDHPGRGTAVLSKEYAFRVFLVSDAFAFVFSILATFWFMDAGTLTVDAHTRRRSLFYALWCLWMAFSGMSTAFAMGIIATLTHSYRSIGILLCIIALGTPILANIGSRFNLYSFRKTVGIRQGWRHWIWPTNLHPLVQRIFGPFLISRRAIIYYLLPILGSYAVFFLLPML